ncbi:unnamed protein product [Porites evermanni]|uniref:Uncharacterized protein n=1 Tax=Porites evermanni TaxID=104178 RepID=A0ABN8MS81_9CNID|nr:unnamed protein product [Porites evermanni]
MPTRKFRESSGVASQAQFNSFSVQEVHTRQQVAGTSCGKMSQPLITPSVMAHFYKNFVLATRLNLCDLFGYVSCDSFTKVLVSIPVPHEAMIKDNPQVMIKDNPCTVKKATTQECQQDSSVRAVE